MPADYSDAKKTSLAFAKGVPPEFVSFSNERKTQILTQVDQNQWSALFFAIYNQPTAVEPILKAMESLSSAQQVAMLTHLIPSNWNALMFATRYQPTAVAPILKAIESLSPALQVAILTQLKSCNWNALMIATRHQPTAVAPILNAMGALTSAQKIAMMTQLTHGKWNALLIAVKYQPTAVDPILNAINLLEMSFNDKYSLLNSAFSSFPENAAIRSAISPFIWEKDVRTLLKQLKPVESRDNVYILNPDATQMKLYNSLTADFTTYLNSSKSPAHLKIFHNAWDKTIATARQDKSLSRNIGLMDILKTLTLILSLVGIVYLAYKAGQNSAKNKSLFFPGRTEKTLNALQDKQQAATATVGAADESDNDSNTSGDNPPAYAPPNNYDANDKGGLDAPDGPSAPSYGI